MNIFKHRRRLYLLCIDFLIIFCTYLAIVAANTLLGGKDLKIYAYALDFCFSVAVIFILRIVFATYNNVWR